MPVHRSSKSATARKPFAAVHEEAKTLLRELLEIPSGYSLLFLQGGSSLQFTMLPMNLLGEKQTADYILTGSWGKKAFAEAQRLGSAHVAWDGKADNYSHLPADAGDRIVRANAAYAHYTDNETIQGVEFQSVPDAGSIPLVCDTSSNFLSRPIDVGRYGIDVCLRTEERGHRGRDRRDHPRRLARARAEESAADARLQAASRERFALQHAARVWHLCADADRPLAEATTSADWTPWPGCNQEKAKLLYDVLDAHSRLLSRARPAGQPIADERYLAVAEPKSWRPSSSSAAKERNLVDLEGASQRRRHPREHLQRDAQSRRGIASRLDA